MPEQRTTHTEACARAGFAALSESERLLITSLRAVARQLAEATFGMSEREAERYIEEAIFELIQSLGQVSEAFAAETAQYLRQATRRARTH